jgi:hypothetical protein
MADFEILNLNKDEIDYEKRIDKSKFPQFVIDYLKEIHSNIVLNDQINCLKETIFMCEVLIDYSWEMLNTNIWVFVDDCWRLLYAHATLYKIICLKIDQSDIDGDKLVKLCDLGNFINIFLD